MTSSTPRTIVVAFLVVGAVLWVLFNDPVEGRTLIVLTPDHGLTEADLLSLAAVAGAAILVLTGRNRRRGRTGEKPRKPNPAG